MTENSTCRANLTHAPMGRSGWMTVFCRCHKKPVYYANDGIEALAKLKYLAEGCRPTEKAGVENMGAATMTDQPPVPWSEAPDDAKWMTRDDDGAVDAWSEERPVLWNNAVWDGDVDDMIRLRWPDGDEHDPKIWERPE